MSNLCSHAIKFAFPVASLVSRKLEGGEKQGNLIFTYVFFQCNIKAIYVILKQTLMNFGGQRFHCEVARINFVMKSILLQGWK